MLCLLRVRQSCLVLLALLGCVNAFAQDFKIYNQPNFLLPMYPDQQFADLPDSSSYMVAHIEVGESVQIQEITTYFSASNPWPLGQGEAVLNIMSHEGGLPTNDYDPRSPMLGGEGVVVSVEIYAVGPKYAVEVKLAENEMFPVLAAGEYWVGLTPMIDFSIGQEFHIASDFFEKNSAVRNPGGSLEHGSDWFEAGPTFSGDDWGMAIRIIGQTTPCEFVLGDVNQDGFANLLDVDPFVGHLTAGTFQCEADTDQDGVVTLLDVSLFVAILAGS